MMPCFFCFFLFTVDNESHLMDFSIFQSIHKLNIMLLASWKHLRTKVTPTFASNIIVKWGTFGVGIKTIFFSIRFKLYFNYSFTRNKKRELYTIDPGFSVFLHKIVC